MAAGIISIGDELVSGLTLDTNSAWLSEQLAAKGIAAAFHLTVGDDAAAIEAALRQAATRCDLLLVTGGLGPTDDDVTRDALAAAMGEALVEDADALRDLGAFFSRIQRPMTPSNRRQTLRPASARCLPNTCGTAPGLRATLGGATVFVAPGVPREMKEMFMRSILPELGGAGGEVILKNKLNTFGAGESAIGEKLADLMRRGANPSVGTTVHDAIVSVRIYATGEAHAAAAMLATTNAEIRRRLGPLIFGEEQQTLAQAVSQLLLEQHKTLATAESCTGGLLAQLVTDVPGSGVVFEGGFVTYTYNRKRQDVEVSPDLLIHHGAVSAEVAQAMAAGARSRTGATVGLSTTGVAGPDPAEGKPVGLVYIALSDAEGTVAYEYHFGGDRGQIRLRAAQMALARLRWRLLGMAEPTL